MAGFFGFFHLHTLTSLSLHIHAFLLFPTVATFSPGSSSNLKIEKQRNFTELTTVFNYDGTCLTNNSALESLFKNRSMTQYRK